MEVVFGLDVDPYAARTFRRNFPAAQFLEVDIRKVDPTELARQIPGGPGPLLVSACAPCQPYASHHHGTKAARDRSLLLKILPLIEAAAADLVFLENVPGLDTKAPSGTFSRFRRALVRMGFWVAWGIVNCQDFGVPQRRRRLVLIASRLGPIDLPPKTHGPETARDWASVRNWIGDLPPVGAGQSHPDVANHTASALTELNLRRLRASKSGGSRFDWPPELILKCHENHRGHSDVYGRMSWDAPAPALTTKCTSLSNGRFGHPEQDRPITVREAACIQTFPRDFVIDGGIKQATRQVGNAVPVLLAEAIGRQIIAHVAEPQAVHGSQTSTRTSTLAGPKGQFARRG